MKSSNNGILRYLFDQAENLCDQGTFAGD